VMDADLIAIAVAVTAVTLCLIIVLRGDRR
jgi:hypothetical protein